MYVMITADSGHCLPPVGVSATGQSMTRWQADRSNESAWHPPVRVG